MGERLPFACWRVECEAPVECAMKGRCRGLRARDCSYRNYLRCRDRGVCVRLDCPRQMAKRSQTQVMQHAFQLMDLD